MNNNSIISKNLIEFFNLFSKYTELDGIELFNEIDSFLNKFKNNFQASSDILGSVYENILDKNNKNKQNGIYYTPKYIIRYILQNTVNLRFNLLINKLESALKEENFKNCNSIISEITNIKILDPSCGSGAFLLVLFKILLEEYNKIDILLLKFENFYKNKNKNKNKNENRSENINKNEIKNKSEIKRKNMNNDIINRLNIISQLRSKIGVDNKIKLIYKIPLRHIYGIDLDLNALKLA
ncbi:MAG: N-6 DNA methylase, partial [Candidatus Helarchaeota archaeon]